MFLLPPHLDVHRCHPIILRKPLAFHQLSSQQCSNVSQNAMESSNKRVKSLMENEHEDGAAWSKTKSHTKQKELETPVPMDVGSSFLLRKEGGRGEHETMRIILGTVEDVLKWSSAKKSLSPSEILIQCIGVFIKVLKSDIYTKLCYWCEG
nr:PREDICTED: uncharacterized protein LOC109040716 [Bemisia tabaci]